jgi:hypothetical protein
MKYKVIASFTCGQQYFAGQVIDGAELGEYLSFYVYNESIKPVGAEDKTDVVEVALSGDVLNKEPITEPVKKSKSNK